ncbi:MAG TPA: hypothetical protein VMU98_05485 [Acidimicrobiales bacterium]|nr:hypothetical protein [Acidimicrobiales bacterium]
MARLFDSLRNTRWVIWSSPMLLLILVFTLRTHPLTGTAPLTSSTQRLSTQRLSTTSLATPVTSSSTTTLATPVTTSATSTLNPTRPHATTTTPTTPTSVPGASSAVASSPSTASSGASFATAFAANANNGALSGTLRPGDEPVVLPLSGPATWTLVASAGLHATLVCATQSLPVTTQIHLAANVSCQLSLRATQPTSWQLTPQR